MSLSGITETALCTRAGWIFHRLTMTAVLFPWYRSSYSDPRIKSSTADMTSSSVRYYFPAKFLFHVGEKKLVRWYHSRRIWRVINQFNATVMHNSHYNHRLNCVQENCPRETWPPSSVFQAVSKMSLYYYFSKSWSTYPVWVYLEGNNAVGIRKGWT